MAMDSHMINGEAESELDEMHSLSRKRSASPSLTMMRVKKFKSDQLATHVDGELTINDEAPQDMKSPIHDDIERICLATTADIIENEGCAADAIANNVTVPDEVAEQTLATAMDLSTQQYHGDPPLVSSTSSLFTRISVWDAEPRAFEATLSSTKKVRRGEIVPHNANRDVGCTSEAIASLFVVDASRSVCSQKTSSELAENHEQESELSDKPQRSDVQINRRLLYDDKASKPSNSHEVALHNARAAIENLQLYLDQVMGSPRVIEAVYRDWAQNLLRLVNADYLSEFGICGIAYCVPNIQEYLKSGTPGYLPRPDGRIPICMPLWLVLKLLGTSSDESQYNNEERDGAETGADTSTRKLDQYSSSDNVTENTTVRALPVSKHKPRTESDTIKQMKRTHAQDLETRDDQFDELAAKVDSLKHKLGVERKAAKRAKTEAQTIRLAHRKTEKAYTRLRTKTESTELDLRKNHATELQRLLTEIKTLRAHKLESEYQYVTKAKAEREAAARGFHEKFFELNRAAQHWRDRHSIEGRLADELRSERDEAYKALSLSNAVVQRQRRELDEYKKPAADAGMGSRDQE